jgi:hypothetical protein
MKKARGYISLLLLLSVVQLACSLLAPAGAAPSEEATTSAVPSTAPNTAPSDAPNAEPSEAPNAEPSAQAATAAPIATDAPRATPAPTAEPVRLEVVQYQVWTDHLEHIRVNVVFRNPYDYPVAPAFRVGATLLNSAGEPLRDRELYFLDGISGGGGFLQPGETIAANACFTCEALPINEEWASVEIVPNAADATGLWQLSTEVEASIGNVSFEAGSPIFWMDGTVTNTSETTLQRISVRLIVLDPEGKLVGAAEASAWDVGPGATGSFNGYGFGQAPTGPVEYEVTALGVNY